MSKFLRKSIIFILISIFSLSLLVAGGAIENATELDGKEKVVFWYNYTGDEAKIYEEVIADYNASQDKYFVEGLSVTDTQKLIVAMSSNESPDVFNDGCATVLQFQSNGFLQSLNEFIKKENFDTSIYMQQALDANTVDGEIYALPIDAFTIQMFYNKDLLEEAGYTEPPKTMEELYEMALAVTKVEDDGTVEILGYPLFPYASARQELIYGFGGTWWDENGRPSPEDPGILASLNANVRFRNEFGGARLDAFIATANTNRYTEQDMFFQGRQLFRLDGSWLPTMMENFGSTVNYGITLVPGTEAHPEYRGRARFETNSLAIPAMAKNKEGAWDFIKYATSEKGAKKIDIGTGNLPALISLQSDEDILAKPGFEAFIEALKVGNGVQYPQMHDFDEYISMVNAALDTVYALRATPEDAMRELSRQARNLN